MHVALDGADHHPALAAGAAAFQVRFEVGHGRLHRLGRLQHERQRYQDRDGKNTSRTIEPLRLAHTGSRWYLVAWDLQREDWRTFRVDRIERLISTGPQFVPRKFPEDIATYVQRSIRHVSHRYRIQLRLQGTLETLQKQVPRWCGLLEASEGETCTLSTGADTIEMLAAMLVMTSAEFEIIDAPELVPELRKIAARLARATA